MKDRLKDKAKCSWKRGSLRREVHFRETTNGDGGWSGGGGNHNNVAMALSEDCSLLSPMMDLLPGVLLITVKVVTQLLLYFHWSCVCSRLRDLSFTMLSCAVTLVARMRLMFMMRINIEWICILTRELSYNMHADTGKSAWEFLSFITFHYCWFSNTEKCFPMKRRKTKNKKQTGLTKNWVNS